MSVFKQIIRAAIILGMAVAAGSVATAEKPAGKGKKPAAIDWTASDADRSGGLNEAEFAAFRLALLAKWDANKDGSFTAEEFSSRGKQQNEKAKARLTELFGKLDADADGKLVAAELGKKFKRDFKKADADASGETNPEEAPDAFK